VTLKGQGRDPNTLRAQYLKTAGNRGGYYPSWRPSVGDLDLGLRLSLKLEISS